MMVVAVVVVVVVAVVVVLHLQTKSSVLSPRCKM